MRDYGVQGAPPPSSVVCMCFFLAGRPFLSFLFSGWACCGCGCCCWAWACDGCGVFGCVAVLGFVLVLGLGRVGATAPPPGAVGRETIGGWLMATKLSGKEKTNICQQYVCRTSHLSLLGRLPKRLPNIYSPPLLNESIMALWHGSSIYIRPLL